MESGWLLHYQLTGWGCFQTLHLSDITVSNVFVQMLVVMLMLNYLTFNAYIALHAFSLSAFINLTQFEMTVFVFETYFVVVFVLYFL